MEALLQSRRDRHLSQRRLAQKASVSFRTVQLLESRHHDPRLSSLKKIAGALGYPTGWVREAIEARLRCNPFSVEGISLKLARMGKEAWKGELFEFVDEFRHHPGLALVKTPPCPATPPRIRALLASTVESLCGESSIPTPWWCDGVGSLPVPWFVSGMESLKASALVESPVHFRKRNLFVLGNFLSRA